MWPTGIYVTLPHTTTSGKLKQSEEQHRQLQAKFDEESQEKQSASMDLQEKVSREKYHFPSLHVAIVIPCLP